MRRDFLRRSAGMVAFCLGILLARPAAAQQPAVTGEQAVASAPEDERAQLENYIRVMKAELERSEARANAVKAQLVSLDDDIESRVDRMVSLLASVRDSTDASGIRIRKAKEDAIAGLKATTLRSLAQPDRGASERGGACHPTGQQQGGFRAGQDARRDDPGAEAGLREVQEPRQRARRGARPGQAVEGADGEGSGHAGEDGRWPCGRHGRHRVEDGGQT